jgi:fucose permease
VDLAGNALMVELWGRDVDPFMQAMHAFFGVGAVVSPALVGAFGYFASFMTFGVFAGVPLIGIAMEDSLIRLITRESDDVLLAGKAGSTAEAQSGTDARGALRELPRPIAVVLSVFLFVYVGCEVRVPG